MTYRLSDIVHETERHFVIRVDSGFEVYRNDGVAAVRCARIGYRGDDGLGRAICEVERREGKRQCHT
jgi:hypothetical protein